MESARLARDSTRCAPLRFTRPTAELDLRLWAEPMQLSPKVAFQVPSHVEQHRPLGDLPRLGQRHAPDDLLDLQDRVGRDTQLP